MRVTLARERGMRGPYIRHDAVQVCYTLLGTVTVDFVRRGIAREAVK